MTFEQAMIRALEDARLKFGPFTAENKATVVAWVQARVRELRAEDTQKDTTT